MARRIVIVLVAFLSFILQSTLMRGLSFSGIGANLILIVTSVCGFMNGRKTGLLVGFTCGMLYDVFFGSYIGLYSLLYMYIGYANGYFHRIFFPEDIKLPLLLIAGSDVFFGVFVYLLTFLLRGRFHFPFYLVHIILPELVYTVLVAVIVYPIFLKVHKLFDSLYHRREHGV